MRKGLIGGVVAVLLCATAASSAPAPQTIVAERGLIRGFARDGQHIGWATYRPRAKCFSAVTHRRLNGGVATSLVSRSGFTCGHEVGLQLVLRLPFAVAGNQALWVLSESGNDVYDHVIHGVVGRPDRELDLFRYSASNYDGDRFADLAGAGRTLVYGWYEVVITDDSCAGECRWEVRKGGVRRVVNRRPVTIPGTPPALLVATNGPRVAIVPAQGEATRFGIPYERRGVEVRDVESGRVVSSFRARRNVLDLALGDKVVAVLIGGPLRIQLYNARSGQFLGSVSVPRETTAIAASGGRLVLEARREIHLLDLETGRLRRVVEARSNPLGASVAGDRVSWAQNVDGLGYVRSLAVP